MFTATPHSYLVPFDSTFRVARAPTSPAEGAPSGRKLKESLASLTEELSELQRMLFAQDRQALLLIFQAMDAAGKDGTIRAVMTGVNPAGCQVFSFRQPSAKELDHDFLWRTALCLPERGRIGIFNRSYYEEVLVVRVHPEILTRQQLPGPLDLKSIWGERLESIRDHEKHLARNGTVVLKFWLNVSREEQRSRFLARIEEPQKNWKFSEADVEERMLWDQYMNAYQEALSATSRPWAPWYAVPADNKHFMRFCVAEIVVETLKTMGLRYPDVGPDGWGRFQQLRELLEKEGG